MDPILKYFSEPVVAPVERMPALVVRVVAQVLVVPALQDETIQRRVRFSRPLHDAKALLLSSTSPHVGQRLVRVDRQVLADTGGEKRMVARRGREHTDAEK